MTRAATRPAPFPTHAVLDGGLATQLEAQGEDLSSSLWSAAVLRAHPDAITRAHAAFFAAGAEVATTATYQLTPMSLSRSGIDPRELSPLTRLAVEAARSARDAAGLGWVVGSVGPYGASLANGSEYTGSYDLPADPAEAFDALRHHHRERLIALLDNGVDALACETIPMVLEIRALVAELTDLAPAIPVWFSVTPAAGGLTTRRGEALAAVTEAATAYPETVAVGVNCCAPTDVAAALTALNPAKAGLVGVAYPNSGETWDAVGRRWLGEAQWADDAVTSWQAAGATLIGGCCRVFPDQITRLSRASAAVVEE